MHKSFTEQLADIRDEVVRMWNQQKRRVIRRDPDLVLGRYSGVRLRLPCNGEPKADKRGPFIKYRDHHLTLRVRGNLDTIAPRQASYAVGNLIVIARVGPSGRRFICVEFFLADEEVQVLWEARIHTSIFKWAEGWVSTFHAPEESFGAVSIYPQQKLPLQLAA